MTLSYVADRATRRVVLVLSGVTVALAATVFLAPTPDESFARLDALFETWNKPNSPGCAAGVMKEGELIYAQGFGMADLERRVPLTADTQFDVASMAKQFTGAAVALLIEERRIDAEDDIRQFFPELRDYGAQITIDDLIHHQSGIRDYSVLAYIKGAQKAASLDNAAVVRLLARQEALNFSPGERFLYSNSNYVLLAEVVERVAGEPLADFIDMRLLQPLGMTATGVRTAVSPGAAIGYTAASLDGGYTPAEDNSRTYGDGHLLSSIRDIARWDENLYRGAVGGEPLLAAMRTRGSLESGASTDYGYGLQFADYRGLPIEHHGGTTDGFRSQLMRFPTQRLSIAVFCNVSTANADQLTLQIADIVLDEALLPRDASSLPATEVRIDPSTFDEYAGAYSVPEDEGSYVMTVSRDNDRYFVQRPGTPPIEMFASSDSEFFLRVSSARFAFHRSEPGGAVTRVSITQPGGTKEGHRISTSTMPSEEMLRRFVGRYYSDELEVVYEIALSEGQLTALGAEGRRLPLSATLENRFAFPGDGEIAFSYGPAGAVAGFTLSMTRARNIVFAKN